MTTFNHNPPKQGVSRQISVLVYPGLCMFEFACVAEVFGLKRPELGSDWYKFETVSIDGNPVKTQYHGEITPNKALKDIKIASTIIIPGWSNVNEPIPTTIITALINAYRSGSRLVAICSGSFVLAETGLLNGKSATTHWQYVTKFKQQYPQIRVETDVLYIDEQSILTSAGSAAGLDLCLHLIRKDYGSTVVNHVAKRLVIPPHREGDQAQFIQLPVATDNKSAISAVLQYIRQNLADTHTISQLAASINVSERTFLRRFKASTSTTPSEWLITARLQYAKELLENTVLPIDILAEKSGFGTATTLRHHFRSRLHIAPLAYRKRFSQFPKTKAKTKTT